MRWQAHLCSSDRSSVVLFGVTPDDSTGIASVLYLCLASYLTEDEYTLINPRDNTPVCVVRLPRDVLEYPSAQVFKDVKVAYESLEIDP